MVTIQRSETFSAGPEKVFEYFDDLNITGMHMTRPSLALFGSKFHTEFLTQHHTGPGSTYRWSGKMMGMVMDFTVQVTKWIHGKEKIWETIGIPRMIIFSWYRMHLFLNARAGRTIAELSISYEKPDKWYFRILSFLFARIYCVWCLRNMLRDSKKSIESVPRN